MLLLQHCCALHESALLISVRARLRQSAATDSALPRLVKTYDQLNLKENPRGNRILERKFQHC